MTEPPKLIVSTSGLESKKKQTVQTNAAALGLLVMPDLTAACTHLISDTVLSDKYLVAVQMRIPVVSTEWVYESACYGELLDEEDYLLRPFHRLVICVSGSSFGHYDRLAIQSLIEREGGKYSCLLDSQVTHLVVDAPIGENYLHCCSEQKLTHVRVVSPAWLAASISRGVCADAREFGVQSASGHFSAAPAQLDFVFGPRLFAQSISELYLSSCVLYIPEKSSGAALHSRLIRAARMGGATTVDTASAWVTHIVLGDMGGSDSAPWDDVKSACPHARLISHEWLLQCDRLRTFLHPSEYEWVPQPRPTFPIQRSAHNNAEVAMARFASDALPRGKSDDLVQKKCQDERCPSQPCSGELDNETPTSCSPHAEQNFLRDVCLLWVHASTAPHGGPRAKLFLEAESHGAITLEMSDGNLPLEWKPFTGRAYAIADHGKTGAHMAAKAVEARQSDGGSKKTRAASWEWLNESLKACRILSVSEHRLMRPIDFEVPLPEFNGLKISFTGFPYLSHERRFAERLVQILGAKAHTELKRSSTHLIAWGSKRWGGKKCERAAELGTPVLTAHWLDECARQGKLVDHASFLLPREDPVSISDNRLPRSAPTHSLGDVPAPPTASSLCGHMAANNETSMNSPALLKQVEMGGQATSSRGITAPSPRRRVPGGRSPRFCGIIAKEDPGLRAQGLSPMNFSCDSPADGAATNGQVASQGVSDESPHSHGVAHAASRASPFAPLLSMPPPSKLSKSTSARSPSRTHVALGELHGNGLNSAYPLAQQITSSAGRDGTLALTRHGTMARAEELLRQMPTSADFLAACTRAPGGTVCSRAEGNADDLASESSVASSRRHVRRSDIVNTHVEEEEERHSQAEVRYVDHSQQERKEMIKARMLGSAVSLGDVGSDPPSDTTAMSCCGAPIHLARGEHEAAMDPQLSELEQVVHAHRAALSANSCTLVASTAGPKSLVTNPGGLFAALRGSQCLGLALSSSATPAPPTSATRSVTMHGLSNTGAKEGISSPLDEAVVLASDDCAEHYSDNVWLPTPTKRRSLRSATTEASASSIVEARGVANKRAKRGAGSST